MPMTVRQIHTAESLAAVNKIKSAIRKEGLGFSFDVPKVFEEKRNYMQSDEFLKDEHNAQMWFLGEKLGELRKKISEEIEKTNKTSKVLIVQGINGFSRIKKYLDINPKMNFSEKQSFFSSAENEYFLLKNSRIKNLSRIAKNKLNLW